MMNISVKIISLCAALFLCGSASAQKSAEQPFITIDGKEYVPSDFFNPYFGQYLKKDGANAKSIEDFVGDFANARIVIGEARAQGLDTTQAFKSAVKNYADAYSSNYYYDSQAVEKLARQAAERAREDVKVSHILVPVGRYAFAKDTLAAKQRIDSVYAALKAGARFEDLALKVNGSQEGGDLGYITVFQVPYVLETAAYDTPVGSFSEPVRTEYGYHIVMPTERRPETGMAELAHIMIMRKGSDSLDRKSFADIKEAYARLKAGEPFDRIAMSYTEDASTQASGGYIGFYGIGELLPEIEKLVFDTPDGSFTSIIATPTGWDIIKVLSRVKNSDYDARKDFLEKKVASSDRYVPFQRAYAKSKMQDYPLDVDGAQYDKVREVLSNMGFLFGEWKNSVITNPNEKLFTLGDTEFTTSDFYSSLVYSMDNYGESAELAQVVDEKFGDFVASQVLSLYVAGLPEKDPKVRKAIEEYGESVLSYNLISAYCRDALADVDPDTLSAMYDRNPGKYMWKQRVRFDVVKCDDFESARKARELMSAGKTYQEVLAELNRGIVQVAEGQQITEFPENAFKPDFEVKKGVSDVIEEDGVFFIFNILEIIEPTQKTFDEALPEVREDFVEAVAKAYPAKLRETHQIQITAKQLKALSKAVASEKKKRGIK